MTSGPAHAYTVDARSATGGPAEVITRQRTIGSCGSAGQSDTLPGPADLLTAAFAACVLKNVERFSHILRFAYQRATIHVEATRRNAPPRMTSIRYLLTVATDESAQQVDLLHRNIRRYETIFNTLAAACDVSGDIVAEPARPGRKEPTMQTPDRLEALFAFHGHRCWASTVGVRAGLAALGALGTGSSGGKSLHAIVDIGDHHGAMCFADGIQVTTGCTLGKGNITKSGKGKLAVTLIDTATGRKVHVAYKPTLQPQIRASAFMQKRAAGVPPTEIPEAEQWELVHLIWDAPEADVLTTRPVEPAEWRPPEEIVRFAVCPKCGQLVAEPYLRVVNGEAVCIDCSGYPS